MRFGVAIFLTLVVFASTAVAANSPGQEKQTRKSDSFTEIIEKHAKMPGKWRETLIVGRMNEIIGDIEHISSSEVTELSEIVAYLDKSNSATDTTNRALVAARTALNAFDKDEGKFEEAYKLNIDVASLAERVDDNLMKRSESGMLSTVIMDEIIAADGTKPSRYTETLVLRAKKTPARQNQIFRLIENIESGQSVQSAIGDRRFMQLCNLFAELDVDGSESVARVRTLVRDETQPARTAAMLVANPKGFAKLNLRLGDEFVVALTKENMHKKLRERAVATLNLGATDFSDAEKAARIGELISQQRQAYRVALGDSVEKLLKRAAAGEILDYELDRVRGALELAFEFKRESDLGLLSRISRMGLTDGPILRSSNAVYHAVDLRSLAIAAISGQSAKAEAQRALIDALDDPEAKLRTAAADVLKKADLTSDAKQRIADVLASIEAREADPAKYLGTSNEDFQNFRRRLMRTVSQTTAPVDGVCPIDFARIAEKTAFTIVK